MPIVNVYRLECRGKGAYWSALMFQPKVESHRYHRNHYDNPSPFDDCDELSDLFYSSEYSDYYFGFKDEKQYLNWFKYKSYRKILYKHDASLKIYSVEEKHIVYGKHQLVFLKHNAKCVGECWP